MLRWNNPELGKLPASAFIPDVEDSGLIQQLDEWVLNKACEQLNLWDRAGATPVIMAINISSKQLIPDFPRIVNRILKEHKIHPYRLQLEFSESQLLENLDRNIEIIDGLKKIGLEISIDNYTGKASMANLARVQAKTIKFALAMVNQMNDPQMVAVTISTIAAARSLGMAIDAVGVETEEKPGFLRSNLVSSAKGYLFGKPVTADETLQKLFVEQDKVNVYTSSSFDR